MIKTNFILFLLLITINSNASNAINSDLRNKEISATLGLVKIIKLSKKFKCKHCDSSFMNKKQLQYHIRCYCTQKPVKCHLCSKSYYSEKSLGRHIQNKHSK